MEGIQGGTSENRSVPVLEPGAWSQEQGLEDVGGH